MLVPYTENNRQIQQAVASLAIENMYLSKSFINKLIEIGDDERAEDELLQDVIRKYKGGYYNGTN
ncbi:MAG: hypothetical protein IKN43_13915 [Selenomonadaceae bacterium]|nr:hypothetical protein [Selenomonadaceae bacterium]